MGGVEVRAPRGFSHKGGRAVKRTAKRLLWCRFAHRWHPLDEVDGVQTRVPCDACADWARYESAAWIKEGADA